MNLAALAIAALSLGLFSLERFRYLLKSDRMRVVLCLIMATAFQSDELIGDITCVHSFLFLAVLLAILQPAESYTGRYAWSAWALALAGLAGALSEPASVLLVPFAAWLVIRGAAPRAVCVPIVLAAAAQIAVYFFVPYPYLPASQSAESIGDAVASAVVYRAVISPIAGLQSAQFLSRWHFYSTMLVMLPALALWLRGIWSWRTAACAYLILATITTAIAGRHATGELFGPAGITGWRSERYFYAAACLFAYLVALTVERFRWKSAALAGVFAIGTIANFRAFPYADLHWVQYAPQIDRWRNDRHAGRRTEAVSVPINPGGPQWKVELPSL
jgi:hypothetical protein